MLSFRLKIGNRFIWEEMSDFQRPNQALVHSWHKWKITVIILLEKGLKTTKNAGFKNMELVFKQKKRSKLVSSYPQSRPY